MCILNSIFGNDDSAESEIEDIAIMDMDDEDEDDEDY